MKRRGFLIGLGGLTGAGSMILGSGAFTEVTAERTLEVTVVGDGEAYLTLSQLGDGNSEVPSGRSIEDGSPETVVFSFPGIGEQDSEPDLGLGPDSIYEFDRDAGESDQSEPVEGLLRIENNGNQPVLVYSQFNTNSELEVELYDVSDSDRTALRDEPAELGVGEYVDVGFRIRTFDADTGTFDETLEIIGVAADDGQSD